MSKQTNDTVPVAQDEKEAEAKEIESQKEDEQNMTPLQALFYATKNGQIDKIKAVVGKVSDINAPDMEGTKHQPYISHNTALHYAVLSGSLETVKMIHSLGAGIDSKNKIECTPLHLASALGYTEIVQFLINMKANIEAKNKIGNTPLHCAVYAGHLDTVKAILEEHDVKREALLHPVNGIGFGAVKYTAHDEMKAYLRQYFPKKRKDGDIDGLGNTNIGNEDNINNNNNGTNAVEEEEPEDTDEADETTGLTSQ